MIGAILAGGYGKRLRPYTERIPKGLLELKDGYTILHKQLDDFSYAGIKKVFMLTSHLSQRIEETFGSEYRGMRIEYLHEDKPMGKMFSMRNLISAADTDAVVRNGDTVSDIDLRRMIDFSNDSGKPLTVHVTRMRSPYGVVDVDHGAVRRFREKPLLDVLINAGVYIIRKEIFHYFMEQSVSFEPEIAVFPSLAERGLVSAYYEDGEWLGIDSEKDLESARNEFAGRDDFQWGYRKLLLRDGNVSVWSLRINSNREVPLWMDNGVMRVVSGSVEYNTELCQSGSVSVISAGGVLKSSDISIVEITQLG